MMVRRDAAGVRLLTRNGIDWSARFPLICEAAGALQVRSFLLDGEAVACDGDGMPVFDRLRYRRQNGRVFLYAFDLLELNGQHLRREPIEVRKRPARDPAAECPGWPAAQRAPRARGRGGHLPPRLQTQPQRHRVEAARLALLLRPVEGLAEVQEPGRSGGEAGGRRGLGKGEAEMIIFD